MSWTGKDGDKRNTKYALAGAGGAMAGTGAFALSPTARRITSVAARRGNRAAMQTAFDPSRLATRRQIVGAGLKAQASTPGFKRLRRARAGAGLAGAALATGAYAASRKRNVDKSDGNAIEKFNPVGGVLRARKAPKPPKRTLGGTIQGGTLRAARGAGSAWRYTNQNAMPLLVGGSIGGGATMAGMQMSDRRKSMSKSDSEYVYVTERLSKKLPSALRAYRAAGSTGRAPGGAYGVTRVTANSIGRQGQATASRNWESQFGPGTLSRARRAGATGGTGKLGVESGAAARGAAARKKRGQLVAARKPGQPGQRVLP